VILQGIVDLLVQRPQGILVVDYKTDAISPKQLPERIQTYKGQLNLYARAVREILKTEVVGQVLYFTALQQEVSLV
jgi:ATP-dependent helicase/nuclease subunit A